MVTLFREQWSFWDRRGPLRPSLLICSFHGKEIEAPQDCPFLLSHEVTPHGELRCEPLQTQRLVTEKIKIQRHL